MQKAYISGDPYLAFAKQAGAVPPDGTKQSHPTERKLFKACVLGVQYGMGPESLAVRIGEPVIRGRELILMHKEAFPDYWKWSAAVVNYALTNRCLHSVMGWSISLNGKVNARALANWPVQTNGAEIMRLAVILATDAEVRICCPVHDALLIEARLDQFEHDIKKTQQCMQEAGEIVLNGFKLRTDVDRVRYPDRYMDERGVTMWTKISELLEARDEGTRQDREWIYDNDGGGCMLTIGVGTR
jgi:DNA polymerase-1